MKKSGYILTITNIFSRITRLYFYYKIDSHAIVKGIKEWIERYGKPKVIISDNGRQYISEETKNFINYQKINYIFILIYTPSSNEISESLNKTITFVLSVNRGNKKVEKATNINYNRNLKAALLSIIRKYDIYDSYKKLLKFKYPLKIKKIEYIRVGDYCREKLYGAKKLEPKYSIYKEVVTVSKKGF